MPAPYKAVPAMVKGDLHRAFDIMLEDKQAEEMATIAVEKINGSLLLVSATEDEFWPSTAMSNQIMDRLENNDFEYYYEHIPIKGGHAEPLNHFDVVFKFLENHFR